MTEPQTATSTGATVTDVRWQASPYPALVLGTDGTVRAVNDAAQVLFPDARAGGIVAECLPDWLVDGHTGTVGGGSDDVRGWVGERSVVGQPVLSDDEAVTWWLVDDTEATPYARSCAPSRTGPRSSARRRPRCSAP